MSYRRSALVSTAGSPTTLSVSRMQLKPELESAESGGVNETTIQLRTMETSQEEADEKTTMDTSLSSTTTPSEPTLLELFPWISDFQRFCRSALQEQSMASLIHLMEFYTRNVNESVDKCLTKRLHAARLKEFMSESLPLFLFYYRGIHEGRQRERYLDAMSDILALYVDLELKASRSKEHAEVCSRITTCLYVYLEDSTEHLLETLMKVQLKIQLNRNYHHILDPLIMKLFQGLSNFAPKDGAMYVRYLLVCRLWEKMNSGITDKKRINTLTLTLLALDDTLILQEFPTKCALPQIPKSEESNPIKFLLLENFDVRDSCRKFLKLAHPPTESSTAWPEENLSNLKSPLSNSNSIRKNNNDNSPSDQNASLLNTLDSARPIPSGDTKVNNSKSKNGKLRNMESPFRKRRKKTKREIIMIDLTSDQVVEEVIKNSTQQNHRKLPVWLSKAKKLNKRPNDFTLVSSNSENNNNNNNGSSNSNDNSNSININNNNNNNNLDNVNSGDDPLHIATSEEDVPEISLPLDLLQEKEEKKEPAIEVAKYQPEDETNLAEAMQAVFVSPFSECQDNEIPVEKTVEVPAAPPTTFQKLHFPEEPEKFQDGLSLLASVSQHFEPITSGVKVKDLKNLIVDQTPSPEQNVFYPKDEVALNVEIGGADIIDPYNVEPIEYQTTQPVTKETSSGVILNGETVVLLQKSPNSNLYIINKAVEGQEEEETSIKPEKEADVLVETTNFLDKSLDFETYICFQDRKKVVKMVDDEKCERILDEDQKKSKKQGSDLSLQIDSNPSPKKQRQVIKQEFENCNMNRLNGICGPGANPPQVSCNVQIHTENNYKCRESRTLNCTYDIRYRQYRLSGATCRQTCMDVGNPYYLTATNFASTEAADESSTVPKVSELAPIERLSATGSKDQLNRFDWNKKLPLKKRLKEQMVFEELEKNPLILDQRSSMAANDLEKIEKGRDGCLKKKEERNRTVGVNENNGTVRSTQSSKMENKAVRKSVTTASAAPISAVRSSRRNMRRIRYLDDEDREWTPTYKTRQARKRRKDCYL